MRATELRMLRADVPVGSYLSGGLDSSLVAWMGRQAKEGSFQTFSLRFDDAEFDETAFQRLMASQLTSTHHEIVVSRHDIAGVSRSRMACGKADIADSSCTTVSPVAESSSIGDQGRSNGRKGG